MTLKKKVSIFVSTLIIAVSAGSAIANYFSALSAVEAQLINNAMPLSLNNIYSEIQKNILEPNLVASMMANDTFLHKWIAQGEQDVEQVRTYLEKIQHEYGLLTTFFVSEATKNYYTQKGIIDRVKEGVSSNAWYFRFRDENFTREMNLDTNEKIDQSLILFINNKVLDKNGTYLGACGTALKINYIQEMLDRFLTKHHFNVFFTDESGKVLLRKTTMVAFDHLDHDTHYAKIKSQIFANTDQVMEIARDNMRYLITSRFIPELRVYVLVEAQLDHFMREFKRNLYFEVILALIVALVVLIVILYTTNSYQKKIERLASHDALTNLPNRRTFNLQFQIFYELTKRNDRKLTLLFLDIDNFKYLNDHLGHLQGDEVLKRMAYILNENMRKSDLVARWGGEEFAVLLHDTDKDDGYKIAEKIREKVETDRNLKQLSGQTITVSIGLTVLHKEDTIDTLLARADSALYRAKREGKNMTVTIS